MSSRSCLSSAHSPPVAPLSPQNQNAKADLQSPTCFGYLPYHPHSPCFPPPLLTHLSLPPPVHCAPSPLCFSYTSRMTFHKSSQDICTSCAFPPRQPCNWIPTSLRSLLQCYLIKKAFPHQLKSNSIHLTTLCSLPLLLHTLLPSDRLCFIGLCPVFSHQNLSSMRTDVFFCSVCCCVPIAWVSGWHTGDVQQIYDRPSKKNGVMRKKK